jgi:nucleoside-diphosphate-sugar epimerase
MTDARNRVSGRVIVTGGAGFAGPGIITHLMEQGYSVTSVDLQLWPDAPCRHMQADLRDLGQTLELFGGYDAVVHLAAVRHGRAMPPAISFETNFLTTFNVFRAASLAGVRRVVWASTTGLMGSPFGDNVPWASSTSRSTARSVPKRVPFVESDAPFPSTMYQLSKVLAERLADQPQIWGATSIVTLRFGTMCYVPMYADMARTWADPKTRADHLWNYVDMRDAAQICARAIAAEVTGAREYFVTAEDTFASRPSRELLQTYFPETEIAPDIAEYGSMFSIVRAKQELGYRPQHSWRDVLKTL